MSERRRFLGRRLAIDKTPRPTENPPKPDKKFDGSTERVATGAVKLGILADRGRLHQQVGKDSLEIRVVNGVPSSMGKRIAEMVDFEWEASQTILEGHNLSKDVTPNQRNSGVKDWLARAVNLYSIFLYSDLATLQVGEKEEPLTTPALEVAWREEGFGEVEWRYYPVFADTVASVQIFRREPVAEQAQ